MKENVNEECREVPYVLGRLFAVLERLQYASNPDIKATIVNRYINSASQTPAYVFPRLLSLSTAHLRKVSYPTQVVTKKKIQNLLSMISQPDKGTPIPKRLPLEDQGVFFLGYYQEMEKQYAEAAAKKKEKAIKEMEKE